MFATALSPDFQNFNICQRHPATAALIGKRCIGEAVGHQYATKLGLAFQVIDDVLDCEADTATLGKTAGKDADNDKPTYVKLMGLTEARAYAEKLTAEAVALLQPFGDKAAHLRRLAEFVTARKH